MTTFSDLLTDVIAITKRPDLEAQTRLAIRNAARRLHQSDSYPKDIFETGLKWDVPAYLQSLEYATFFPRWRSLLYLRKFTPGTGGLDGYPGIFFESITPKQTMDEYGYNRDNVYYQAGGFIEIRSSTQDEYMLCGFYIWPDLTELSFNSWIADYYPDAVIYAAVRDIFSQIGYQEMSAEMNQREAMALFNLKQELQPGGV